MAGIKQKTIHREFKLRNWGNSKAIRLTKDVLEEAGLDGMNEVVLDVEIEPNKITLNRKDNLTPFQKLFDGYKGEKPQHNSLRDNAEPVGKEDW